jgi:hypothetical protein
VEKLAHRHRVIGVKVFRWRAQINDIFSKQGRTRR